jgi:transcriptional regulator
MEDKDFKNKVIEVLRLNPQGLTIQEISDLLNTTRITISIALAELKGENKLFIREIGSAKLHLLKQEVENEL